MLLVIQWLENILWWLSKIVYKLIPDVYAVFEFFAKQKFFTMGELANFWNNLYIVMSVLVLFAIGIKLISAIVNPDVLDGGPKDAKKKNAKRTFFDAIIAVFLIILVPMVFSMLNSLQTEIIESKFIQKYIFGISFTAESQTNVGQVLAYQTISSFMYPCDVETEPKCKPPADEPEKGKYQMNALSWDIKNIDAYIPAEDLISDQWGDGNVSDNTLRYHYVLGLAAGILVLYQIILLALDMALRAAKIGMLELMLPIILGAFIFNRDILTKWIKEFIATYLSAFLKLMAVTMMVLGLSRINILFESFEKDITFVDGAVAKGLLRLILLMGILRLVKEIPNIINKIFGTNIQYQGGLRGRLGQMAGVGGLAQRAWDTLRTHPIQTARRLVAAPLSAVGGAVSHGAAAFSRGRQQWQNGQIGAAIRTGIGGFFGLGGAAARAGRQGWQNGNLQGIGAQGRRYADTHLPNSTFGGRLIDTARTAVGLRTREEQALEDAEREITIRKRQRSTGGHVDQTMTFEELASRQKLYDQVFNSSNSIRDTIGTALKDSTTAIQFQNAHAVRASINGHNYEMTGNYMDIANRIAKGHFNADGVNANGIATMRMEDATGSVFEVTEDEYATLMSAMSHNLDDQYAAVRNEMMNQFMANGRLDAVIDGQVITNGSIGGNAIFTGGQIASMNSEWTHMSDIINNNQEMHTDMARENGQAIRMVGDHCAFGAGSTFLTGAMNAIYDYRDDVTRAVQHHNDEIENRRTTDAGREAHASSQAVRNRQNNGGGGSNAGGHH